VVGPRGSDPHEQVQQPFERPFGHPEQDRAISLREAAALQTFPDDYEFLGTRHHVARWIGNAVPVSLAEAVGRAAMAAVS